VFADAKVALEQHQAMCGQQLGRKIEHQRKAGVAEPARPGSIARAQHLEQRFLDLVLAADAAAIAGAEIPRQASLAAGRRAGDQQQPRYGALSGHRASQA